MRRREREPAERERQRGPEGLDDNGKKARDPARDVDFATGEAMRKPKPGAVLPGERPGRAPAPDSIEAWRNDKNATRRDAATKGPIDERRAKVVAASVDLQDEIEWYEDDPSYGKLGCQHLPFLAAVRAGIITEAQAMRLLNQGGKTKAEGMTLILEAVDFVPPKDAPPSRIYPTGKARAGDIAIFCDAESGKTFYEHVAMFTGNGGEIMSLQANFDDDATNHPLVKTTVEEYTTRMGLGASSRVVICPFPF